MVWEPKPKLMRGMCTKTTFSMRMIDKLMRPVYVSCGFLVSQPVNEHSSVQEFSRLGLGTWYINNSFVAHFFSLVKSPNCLPKKTLTSWHVGLPFALRPKLRKEQVADHVASSLLCFVNSQSCNSSPQLNLQTIFLKASPKYANVGLSICSEPKTQKRGLFKLLCGFSSPLLLSKSTILRTSSNTTIRCLYVPVEKKLKFSMRGRRWGEEM